jgi:hypothetical protein
LCEVGAAGFDHDIRSPDTVLQCYQAVDLHRRAVNVHGDGPIGANTICRVFRGAGNLGRLVRHVFNAIGPREFRETVRIDPDVEFGAQEGVGIADAAAASKLAERRSRLEVEHFHTVVPHVNGKAE